jgi:hypothetical protein
MSEQEYLYVTGVDSVTELAGHAGRLLGLQATAGQQSAEVQLLGPTEGSTTETTEVWVRPNEAPVPGRHPDATGGYAWEVEVRVYGPAEVQRGQARRLFDGLRGALPDVALLLTHEITEAVAAYRPGAGVHEFAPGTETDPADFDQWAPWVPRPPG